GQVQLVLTNFFRTQQFRRFAKVTGKQRDMQTYLSWVCGAKFRTCIFSIMRKGGHRKLLCEVAWAAHAAIPGSRKRSLSPPNTQPTAETSLRLHLLVDLAPYRVAV